MLAELLFDSVLAGLCLGIGLTLIVFGLDWFFASAAEAQDEGAIRSNKGHTDRWV